MKITIDSARKLYKALGFQTSDKWTAERFNTKFKIIDVAFEDATFNREAIIQKYPDLESVLDAVQKAAAAKEEITVDEEAPEADVDAPAEKTEKKSKNKSSEDSEEASDDEPKEELVKKSKKNKEKTASAEKPAKKAAAKKTPAKPRESKVERDDFGSKVGSSNAKVNKALSVKPLTFVQIVEKTGLKKSEVRYAHLDSLVENKFAKKVEVDGAMAWQLVSKK